MDLFRWQESYSVGIPSLDAQHKQLVGLLNLLYSEMNNGKGKDALAAIMEQLTSYTLTHFTYEEELFARFSYPEKEAHEIEHRELVEKVKAYSDQVSSGSRTSALGVMNFLKDWLMVHINGTDKKYSDFLKVKGVV